MKNKSLILAGTMSFGLITLANAQQYVYITGSTAARSIVDATLNDTTGNGVFDSGSSLTVVYQGGATSAKATYVTYHGTMGAADTIIKCHWSGSEGGIADLVGGSQQFLVDGASTTSDGTTPGGFVSSPVDIAMADNAVLYSKNPGASVVGKKVGVIGFKWVLERGSAAAITGVTDANIRVALTGGNTKAALFTGNAADTTRVFVTGRDNNSGTRVNAFGVPGFGIFSAPSQIQVSANGAMITQSDSGIVGDYGYSGGGSVATQMGYDLSQATSVDIAPGGDGTSHFSVIAYLGTGDAATAILNGGTELKVNGASYNVQSVANGLYPFWGNEYIYRKSTVTSQASMAYTRLSSTTGSAGIAGHADDNVLIKLTTMQATRNGPTSDPTHN